MTPTRRHLLAAGAVAALAAPRLARGQGASGGALAPVRFILDWAFLGPQSPYLLAFDRGYFREEGIAATIDRGFGSGDTPVKIATGAYDFGVGDISPAMRMRMTTPGSDLITPFVLQQGSPVAAMTLRRSGITTPKGLEGRRIAAPETDTGRQMFPVFAKAAGVDASRINWLTVTPQLREPMLARGEADAIVGFETSGVFSLQAVGVRREDIVSIRYADHGVTLLSTALQCRRATAEANPRIVTGMIRAIIRGHVDAFRDPDAAIASLRRRDATTPVELEKARLIANFEFVRTPEVVSGGFGNLPMPRMQGAIDTIREAFGIAAPMRAEDFYLPRFLPPEEALRFAA